MLGWIAVSWDDPELRFVHLRPMGTSHRNWWTGRVRHGVGQYYMGTGVLYMLASAGYRMTRPPLVVGGLAMLVLPGPGFLVIIGGLAVLATEFAWAAYLLDNARRQYKRAERATRQKLARRSKTRVQ